MQTVTKKFLAFIEKIRSFLNNTFEVSYTKTSKMAGIVLCVAALVVTVVRMNTFFRLPSFSKWLVLALDIVLPFLIGLAAAFTIRFKSLKARKISAFVLLFLMPVLFMAITECLNNVFIYNMTYLGFFANYMVIIIAYFIFFALTGSFKVSYLVVNIVLFGLAFAHSYIMDCRGTPFQPMDFLSIPTAAGVANTYDFSPNHKIITATFLFVLLTIIIAKMKTPDYKISIKIISRAFTGVFASTLLILFYFTSIFANMGVHPDFWNQTRGYHNYGFVFNFFANTKYLYMNEPNDYDPQKIKEMIGQEEQKEEENNTDQKANKPNIICIMNESLSDLSVLGEFKTNKEYMPFLNSLKENTIKGNLYVPVVGAGTSNTEFEFLTGHTTAFLPSGSNAYMLYIGNPTASLVSTLEAQKYSSFALHPYYAKGWNRVSVYSNFGFDVFKALEDIIDGSILQEFQQSNDADYLQALIEQKYPNSNMLVRQYISDSYNYDLIIKDYENRKNKEKPYFAFNVTMQNHGGYNTVAKNFKQKIKQKEFSEEYPKVDQYLSLVKKSDTAFKNLINYFENVPEHTIICMFGDHQPTVEAEFVQKLLDVGNLSNLNVEQELKRHITPFYIWANYDIKEKEIDKLSVNYLSSLVLKTAGVKLTKYNEYLLNLSKTLPVINTAGYIDKDGNYYKWSEVSPYTDLISEYEKIQYNCIFDYNNLEKDTFYLKGYTHKATPIEEEKEKN